MSLSVRCLMLLQSMDQRSEYKDPWFRRGSHPAVGSCPAGIQIIEKIIAHELTFSGRRFCTRTRSPLYTVK